MSTAAAVMEERAVTVIREATENDVRAIVRLGMEFAENSEYRETVKPDPARLANLAMSIIASPKGCALVAERDGETVGMIILLSYEHLFTGERTAVELAWWVTPDARGSIGLRLLRAAQGWAKTVRAKNLVMISPNEKVAAFYRRLGFVHMEDNYQLDLRA